MNFVVTGANSGVGLELTRQLARLGHRVIMACRSLERGEEGKRQVLAQIPQANLEVRLLDLASPASISAFAQGLEGDLDRLDGLINNAGVYLQDRGENAQGLELTWVTNVVGPQMLTRLLIPLLQRSAPSRIIIVGSGFAGGLDLKDPEFKVRPYDGKKAYQQSKQANRMQAWKWARHLEGHGITVNAFSPGMILTGLYRQTPVLVRLFLRGIAKIFGHGLEKGTATGVWLATDPRFEKESGAHFFEAGKELPRTFHNIEEEDRLWNLCEDVASAGSRG
jgi:retinol dehydrogenase-13